MFRLIFMTFWGESRVPHEVEHHIHESPRPMLIPLVTLAVLSIVGGFIGWPKSLGGGEWFGKFLEPVFEGNPVVPPHEYGHEHGVFPHGALGGDGDCWASALLTGCTFSSRRFRIAYRAALAGLHRLLLHKYYVDEIYDALFVNRVKDLGSVAGRV